MTRARREKGASKRKRPAKASNGLNGHASVEEFFPPGLELERLRVTEGDEVTYFLLIAKPALIDPHKAVCKWHLTAGFRAALLGPSTLSFGRGVDVVGRVKGDHFQKASEWVRSNVLLELQQQYLVTGGGTPAEREKTLRDYARVRRALAEHDEKRKALLAAVQAAAVEMVKRFGKQSVELDGSTYDPSFARREIVHYKRRFGT